MIAYRRLDNKNILFVYRIQSNLIEPFFFSFFAFNKIIQVSNLLRIFISNFKLCDNEDQISWFLLVNNKNADDFDR